jgi:hypothetical protein
MSKSPLARAVALTTLGTSFYLPLVHADFIEDSKASLELRNFYFNRDFRQDGGGTGGQSKADEWAQGFWLKAESGYTEGTVGVGLDVMGMVGLKLDSGDGSGGTGLLSPDRSGGSQDNYSQLDVTGKVKVSKSTLKIGALLPKMPVVQYNDTRLLPQTFQGGLVNMAEIDGLSVTAGQLKQVNDRNSSDYTDMTVNVSEKRGFTATGRDGDAFNFFGADYKLTKDLTASYYYGQLEDYYKQHFLGLVHVLPLGEGQSLKTDLRYFKSDDDGNHVSGIDNKALNGLVTYSISGHSFGLGYQRMSGDTGFAYLDGTDPFLVNYVQIGNFSSTEERSWQARYDYNFAAIGIPGLTFMTRYVTGDNIDQGVAGLDEGKEWERNTDIGYVFQQGTLKNLGVKWRNATYRNNFTTGRSELDENRLIVTYSLPLW